MQITINFDDEVRRTWEDLRRHFPALRAEVDDALRAVVQGVARHYGLDPAAAAKLVAGHLLSLRPELVRESVEMAEEAQAPTGWRDLKRKVLRSVTRAFGRPVTKRQALEALAKSVERKEL